MVSAISVHHRHQTHTCVTTRWQPRMLWSHTTT